MKYIFLPLLLLTSFSWATEKKLESKTQNALTGFQKFEIIPFFPSYEKMDKNVICDSLAQSCKKFGQIALSENESMIKNLLQDAAAFPVCFFSFEKDEEQIEVTMDVLAEVEVLANQFKTTCPIWKKTLYSPIPQDSTQVDVVIGNLAQEMIKSFAEDWRTANIHDSKQLSFHVRKFTVF